MKWIFAPLTGPYVQQWRYRNTHFALNGRSSIALGPEAGHLDVIPRDASGKEDPDFPVQVTRGIELRSGGREQSDEAFNASIRRGIYQLQFAHVPRLNNVLRWVGWHRHPEIVALDLALQVTSLVLVTTAELWMFKQGAGLRQVESADSIEEIAQRVDAVEYTTVVSQELRAHQDEWIRAIENAATGSASTPEIKAKRDEIWKDVRRLVQDACPSVLIVDYRHLENVINAQATAIEAKVRSMVGELAATRGYTVR